MNANELPPKGLGTWCDDAERLLISDFSSAKQGELPPDDARSFLAQSLTLGE